MFAHTKIRISVLNFSASPLSSSLQVSDGSQWSMFELLKGKVQLVISLALQATKLLPMTVPSLCGIQSCFWKGGNAITVLDRAVNCKSNAQKHYINSLKCKLCNFCETSSRVMSTESFDNQHAHLGHSCKHHSCRHQAT